MKRLDGRSLRNCIIAGLVFLSACTPTGTPTAGSQVQNTIAPTSTHIPTPLPQFAAPTLPQVANSQSDVASPIPQATNTPVPLSYEGTVTILEDEEVANLYNGPLGSIKESVNNGAPIVILGRSNDGRWLEVRLASGITGWLEATHVQTDAPVSTLAITGYIPQDTVTPAPDALVKSDGAGLRLRTQPNLESGVLTNLDANTELTVIGRTRDNEWIQVITPDRQRGWVLLRFVDVYVDVLNMPVTFGIDTPGLISTTQAPRPTNVITNITDQARRIYERGQTVGNQPAVFSKVGDSLTVATWVLYPIGWGQQSLGSYSYLQPVIDYFSSTIIRDNNNSFSNIPLAADNQWTSNELLNPALGNPDMCGANESPLDCEYRVSRPSIALILIGTNDVGQMDAETYRENMTLILDKTIARSILPVLSTIPPRTGYDAQVNEFNGIIHALASEYGIPVWEYHASMMQLPNNGLEADGLHPSYPPDTIGQWEAAANFVGENLKYGYNMRNLTALQVLDALWRQVILDEPPP